METGAMDGSIHDGVTEQVPGAAEPRPARPGRAAVSDPAAGFVEEMGLLAQADHLPRIAGRILGVFLLEGAIFGQRELAARLKVSRGSVSTNARLLVQLGLLERVAKPADRQDYYQLAPDPYARLLASQIARMNHSHAVISEAERRFPADREECRKRLRDFADFFKTTADHLAGLIRRF